jgi:hypothetical protein
VFCFELFLSGVDLKLGGASWPLQATIRAKGPRELITKAKSGRRSRVLVEQGQETLLLKDQQKLDVSFLMICRANTTHSGSKLHAYYKRGYAGY